MARMVPRGVLLTPADCARLDGLLVRALRDLHLRDGGAPHDLLDVIADIHQLAGEFRASVLVDAGSGTTQAGSGSVGASSEVTERLTVAEAARLTGVSDSYWRRLARRGDVQASRSGSKGEWVLDGGSVAAWAAHRTIEKEAS